MFSTRLVTIHGRHVVTRLNGSEAQNQLNQIWFLGQKNHYQNARTNHFFPKPTDARPFTAANRRIVGPVSPSFRRSEKSPLMFGPTIERDFNLCMKMRKERENIRKTIVERMGSRASDLDFYMMWRDGEREKVSGHMLSFSSRERGETISGTRWSSHNSPSMLGVILMGFLLLASFFSLRETNSFGMERDSCDGYSAVK